MSDENHMSRALSLAVAAAGAGEAPIGCVIVEGLGEIIAEGANMPISAHDPTAHAEIVALRNAAAVLENYRLKPGLTMYVTLEPCDMCLGAMFHARIANVVARAARALAAGGGTIVIELEGYADHLGPGLRGERGDDRAVHPARHGDHDPARFGRPG